MEAVVAGKEMAVKKIRDAVERGKLIEALMTGSMSRAIGNCSDVSTKRNSRYDGTDRPYSPASMCASPSSTRHSTARSGDFIRISNQTMKITQQGFQRRTP